MRRIQAPRKPKLPSNRISTNLSSLQKKIISPLTNHDQSDSKRKILDIATKLNLTITEVKKQINKNFTSNMSDSVSYADKINCYTTGIVPPEDIAPKYNNYYRRYPALRIPHHVKHNARNLKRIH